MLTRMLSLLICTLSFFACQGDQLSPDASLVLQSITNRQPSTEKPQAPTANVIFKSSDGGQTWQDVSAGLPKGFQASSIYADNSEVMLGYGKGLYRSSSTSPEPNWRPDMLMDNEVSNIFPGRPGPYIFSSEDGFYQEIPSSGIWIKMDHALENQQVFTVLETADGATFIGCNNGIFKCTHGAWKQVLNKDMVTMLIASNGVLLGGGPKGEWRSTDGGEHWEQVANDYGRPIVARNIEGGIAAIFIDGVGPWKHVNEFGLSTRLLTSADGGQTWTPLVENLPQVRQIDDILQVGQYLFCSLDSGIYRSSNQGKTWELVRPVSGKTRFKLAGSGETVYVVMNQGGGC